MALPLSYLDTHKVQKPPAQSGLPFPDEIFCEIFGHFSFRELVTVSRVCKAVHRLAFDPTLWNAFDLRRLFPGRLSILGLEFWQAHGSSVLTEIEKKKLIDNRIAIPTLVKVFAQLEKKQTTMPVTLLTMPKGLTIDKLLALAALNGIEFRFTESSLSMLRGEPPIESTYHVIITQGILQKSKNLTFYKQRDLLKEVGAIIPSGLEIGTLAVGTFITSSPSPLYLFGQGTMTRCDEGDEEMPWHVAMGNFSPPQHPHPLSSEVDVGVFKQSPDPEIGIAAVWPLPDTEKS